MSIHRIHCQPLRYIVRNNRCFMPILVLAMLIEIAPTVANGPSTSTIIVTVEPRTGGKIQGAVVDFNDHGLVLVKAGVPYALAWKQIEPTTAYTARRDLIAHQRGGWEKLSAQDHFDLGQFALAFDRQDLARAEFGQASKLAKGQFEQSIRNAWQQMREKRKRLQLDKKLSRLARKSENTQSQTLPGNDLSISRMGDDLDDAVTLTNQAGFVNDVNDEIRKRVREAYLIYGQKVQEVMGKSVVFIETDHFLIWTDWPKLSRDQLAGWLEDMYASLSVQFGIDVSSNIFLAKCPVFCWRSRARYQRFAQKFDGYDGKDSLGYTRSIESNGHVHMAFMRKGSTQADIDRIACTIVHEGTHAFLHRLFTTRLLPHWINEGAAEMTTAAVLGQQCPAGGNAALLARQYARYDWPIGRLFQSVAPIDAHQYPLAQSIVSYLNTQSVMRWRTLIKALKQGKTFPEALALAYDGTSLQQLDADWRKANSGLDNS